MSVIEEEQIVDLDQETEETPNEETQETKVKIPDKFQGKQVEDIVEAYTNLEKEYGRRNNEVGQLRKLTDQLLNLELDKTEKQIQEPQEPVEYSVDDLLENPNEVLNNAVENNPKIKQLEQRLQQSLIENEKSQFESQHSDWMDVVSSTEFQGWLAESPIRLKMFVEADKNYDYATGAELLTLYKESKKAQIDKKVQESDEKRKQSLKSAATDKGGTGETSKKVYRRSDLIQLRIHEPDRFNAMQDEILLAYKEGRVR